MNFRLWFIDWHDIIAVDYTATTKMMEKKQKDMVTINPIGLLHCIAQSLFVLE